MKRKLSISAILMNLLLAIVAGMFFSPLVGCNPAVIAFVVFAGGTGVQFIDPMFFRGIAQEGLNQEIWTDVLVQDFRDAEAASFLNLIPDESRHVVATRGENEVIHLVDVGADPEVLINNTTYPIGFADQTDNDIPISLDSFTTKATRVSDLEIQYIAYDKIRLVQEKHKNAIMDTKHNKAVHALGPAAETATTPVLVTSGPDDGTGRKRLIMKDLVDHKKQYDSKKIPLAKRVLVLTSDHYNDLLIECINANKSTDHLAHDDAGLLNTRLCGFLTFMYVDMPYYTLATLTKKSFGAAVVAGDVQATVSFYAPDMFRAAGSTKNYTDEPTTQNHAWLYNVRHNYIVLPRKTRAQGAILSADV
ncbi:hypothetical protein FUA48_16110 [Flavobacterium alkalisoli]|uniref:Major capsid protein n=1 Tax=Flavobacterium alkalisoli TaxID=2602769 RepID=A0A5B9FVU4_9FLAO|nr:hypothetical protein [Flavobacterium alkalisoli]QEE51045.1 hypothetical protein FUA48_16110 [Flavobacterium alkalisoli]